MEEEPEIEEDAASEDNEEVDTEESENTNAEDHLPEKDSEQKIEVEEQHNEL